MTDGAGERGAAPDIRWRVRWGRVREWLEFDCQPARWGVAWAGVAIGAALWFVDRLKAIAVLTKIHRADFAALPSAIVERVLRDRPGGSGTDYRPHRLSGEWQRYLEGIRASPLGTERAEDPERLLGLRILALKSPGPRERGVLVLDYAYVFPAFLKYFDVQRVMDEYYIVLEPSWTGYANLDLLAFSQFRSPVFIQSAEPRDAAFLTNIGSNLLPVPIAANWWVDHRVFRPLGLEKDIDLIMVASWAPFKRHERIFAALAALRRRGHVLRTMLVGYRNLRSAPDVDALARYHGVRDQVEIVEGLTPEQVNVQYNRARANILWSRREGCNRAIIEGMFADVPCIVREGFNYGYHYEYTNPQTAVYATERSLPDTLLEVCSGTGQFRPREWVANRMTCQHAAGILNAHIRRVAEAAGEAWTNDIAVKHSELGSSRHWNPDDAARFQPDYRRLAQLIRR
jgi:glycosyltransferase involved in cell wall biosynthesis